MTIPCIVLERDNWDDYFTYETNYRAAIFGQNRKLLHEGFVKILDETSSKTKLPEEFDSLTDKFCSLWQNVKDYEAINSFDFGHDVLAVLNDVNYNEVLREKFADNAGMINSLRRYSDAERAYQEGRKILTNDNDLSNFSFAYNETGSSPTPFGTVYFKFSRKLMGLYRIIGIIGRNGVGKTTLLANLATSLSGIKKSHTRLSPRPPFSKIIAVSYSTFDDFYRPKSDERTFSYFYCGIRGEDDLLSKEEINDLFYTSFKRIKQAGLLLFWEECMNILYLNQLDTYLADRNKIMPSFKKLSSGQKIMTMSFTQIIDVIDKNSVLLFDEPETHLHPNGQNTLFKCLDYILNKFDSFAILSTHSPIFIQNIPSTNVIKMNSVNGVRQLHELSMESFGQHFSKLTEEIFGFSENNLYYVEKLKSIHSSKNELGDEYNDLSLIDSVGARFNLKNFGDA
ncbi:AAA family ATPase [Parasediminibacterium sp. JCM 36343]|uniref:AAA family ATPase n=1 Tax=Parasediminibacterium sp. JCM 36343 TaxID=3374279 RepID=UPI003979946E